MAPIYLRMASVYIVATLVTPTNPQMLTAFTENFTPVEGARSSNTYINSVVFFAVEVPSIVNWIMYSITTPLLLDGAFHEMVMLVKVITAILKTT